MSIGSLLNYTESDITSETEIIVSTNQKDVNTIIFRTIKQGTLMYFFACSLHAGRRGLRRVDGKREGQHLLTKQHQDPGSGAGVLLLFVSNSIPVVDQEFYFFSLVTRSR